MIRICADTRDPASTLTDWMPWSRDADSGPLATAGRIAGNHSCRKYHHPMLLHKNKNSVSSFPASLPLVLPPPHPRPPASTAPDTLSSCWLYISSSLFVTFTSFLAGSHAHPIFTSAHRSRTLCVSLLLLLPFPLYSHPVVFQSFWVDPPPLLRVHPSPLSSAVRLECSAVTIRIGSLYRLFVDLISIEQPRR